MIAYIREAPLHRFRRRTCPRVMVHHFRRRNVCSKYFSIYFSGLRLRRESFGRAFSRAFSRTFGRAFGRMSGGRFSAARVLSAAPKKKSFDRGGPVWPPRSNAADDRLGGGLGGLCPPGNLGGFWGGFAPPGNLFFYGQIRLKTTPKRR